MQSHAKAQAQNKEICHSVEIYYNSNKKQEEVLLTIVIITGIRAIRTNRRQTPSSISRILMTRHYNYDDGKLFFKKIVKKEIIMITIFKHKNDEE